MDREFLKDLSDKECNKLAKNTRIFDYCKEKYPANTIMILQKAFNYANTKTQKLQKTKDNGKKIYNRITDKPDNTYCFDSRIANN